MGGRLPRGKGGKDGFVGGCGASDPCCLVRGTAILTDGGPVAIESLEIGTLVMTESGALKPIVGIGRIACSKAANAPWEANVAPILVTQSAISAGVPERDLYLSANHSIWIDDCLIPVRHLVNGSSIVQVPAEVDSIEYYHLEFAQHEVMYAEGLAVESLQVAHAETYRIFTEFRRDDDAPQPRPWCRTGLCLAMLEDGGRLRPLPVLLSIRGSMSGIASRSFMIAWPRVRRFLAPAKRGMRPRTRAVGSLSQKTTPVEAS